MNSLPSLRTSTGWSPMAVVPMTLRDGGSPRARSCSFFRMRLAISSRAIVLNLKKRSAGVQLSIPWLGRWKL